MRKILFSAVLAVLLASPVFAQGPFSDVPGDHWAVKYIQQMVDAGILSGFPDGTFRGKNPVTRYEVAVVVSKLYSVIQGIKPGDIIKGTDGVSEEKLNELKKMVEKLAMEFRDELAALGVRVGKLEGDVATLQEQVSKLGTVAFDGEFRLRHTRYSDATAATTPGNWTQLRTRVNLTTMLTEKSKVMLTLKEANNLTNPGAINLSPGTGGGSLATYLEQAVASINIGDRWQLWAGRAYNSIGPIGLLHQANTGTGPDEGVALVGKLGQKLTIGAGWTFTSADGGITPQLPAAEDDIVLARGELKLGDSGHLGLNYLSKGVGEDAPGAATDDLENTGWSVDAAIGPLWGEYAAVNIGADSVVAPEDEEKVGYVVGANLIQAERFSLSAAYADIDPEFSGESSVVGSGTEDAVDPIYNPGVQGFQVKAGLKVGQKWSLNGAYLSTDPATLVTNYGVFTAAGSLPAGCPAADFKTANDEEQCAGRESLWKLGITNQISPNASWGIEYLMVEAPNDGVAGAVSSQDDTAWQTTLQVKF